LVIKKKYFFIGFIIVILFTGFGIKKAITPYPFSGLEHFPPMPVNRDNIVTLEGADLGRYLFYDPLLSRDSSVSCASCHQQQFAFADGKKFGTGIDGKIQKRNTTPLFNLAWYNAFFWDGRSPTIEQQVFVPVSGHEEMDLNWKAATKRINANKFYRIKFKDAFGEVIIDSVLIAKAIAQFERTLISNQSKYDRVLRGEDIFTHDEREGFIIMNEMVKGDCLQCHTTDADALGTTGKFSNNGLDNISDANKFTDKGLGAITGKITDNGKFKIPSLRNVGFTAPYMHDGRFNTLEEVVNFYSEGVNKCANIDSKMEHAHQRGVQLDSVQKKQVITFLLTMNDSLFVKDVRFSNPFLN